MSNKFDMDGALDNLDSESDGELEGLEDYELEDFEDYTGENESVDSKGSLMKTVSVLIVVGMLLFVGTFWVMRLSKREPAKDNKDIQKVSGQPNNGVVTGDKKNDTNNRWTTFTKTNIDFEEELVEAIFTVTGISNYVSTTGNNDGIQVKSIVEGNMSGFTGTYEIEIAYGIANLLDIGDAFKVKVQVGRFNSKLVVGRIEVR